ncbi:MAG TPA: ABC transporter permease [Dehalococcoidia bacterium]|nr:ABC transporter permease [Dehalococcoidia bacterium]
MRQYAARRILFFIPVVLIVSIITFFGLNLIPGDPALTFLGGTIELHDLEAYHKAHGLEHQACLNKHDDGALGKIGALDNCGRILVEKYFTWLGGMLHGDPGDSLLGGDIKSELKARFPVTLQILIFSFTFTMFFGLLFGALSAIFQDTPLDYAVRIFSIFGLSIPSFFSLTLLLLIPAILWSYSPPLRYVSLWENPGEFLQKVLPPTLILGIEGSAGLMRLVRSALLEVLRQDYIRTARAKGLQERLVFLRHAFKNAMIPVLTIAGTLIAGLLGGSVILEQIMAFQGLGQYTFRAVTQQDYNVVMTMVTYLATVVVTMNLVVDLLYAYVDPRIRYR